MSLEQVEMILIAVKWISTIAMIVSIFQKGQGLMHHYGLFAFASSFLLGHYFHGYAIVWSILEAVLFMYCLYRVLGLNYEN